jgi:H+-transporting ATPase
VSEFAASDLGSLPPAELQRQLGAGPEGLSSTEAAARLERFGPNEIAEKRQHPLLEFASYFWAPFPWMIEVARASHRRPASPRLGRDGRHGP